MKTVVILGMHRSGSTATMGLLRALDIHIGRDRDFVDSNKWNPKGYLEIKEFLLFEIKILHNSGGSWKNIVPEKKALTTFNRFKPVYMYLLKKYGKEPMWSYKAVRAGLYPESLLNCPNLHLIISYRNPTAVTASLAKRNGLTKIESLELWSEYYYRIFKFVAKYNIPYLLIEYDDIIDSTECSMRKVAKFLDIEINQTHITKGEKWIDSRLRHYRKK